MIDSHAHLNDPRFAEDLDDVIGRAEAAGVQTIINIGYDLESSRRAVELTEQYTGLWAVVGLHPHDARLWTEEVRDALAELAQHPKVVAIGEVGLDYHYDNSPRDKQREVFGLQLTLARELGLPAVIHSRDASGDTVEIIEKFSDVNCLLHCYSGSWETAEIYRKLGHFFSFGGPITFNNAHKLRGVARRISPERLLVETDCPYLTPHPFRGKRNEPAYLPYIVEKLAELHGLTAAEMTKITVENTKHFFRLTEEAER
ncbi:MAG TPA: TatD family hydrolase [Firmicutes bacterium]|nr:TatD family hydrolase [Bacillota bacterium]